MNANQQVNEALRRWAILVGLDPDVEDPTQDDWRPSKSLPWDKYDIVSMAKDLNRSRQLDPTGLTALMLLRGITEHLLGEVKFTAYEIVLHPQGIEGKIAPMRDLRDVLEQPEVVGVIEEFQALVRKAADHYDYAHRDALEHLLADKWDLANVRRDALRSIEDRLETHQFTWGQPDPCPVAYSPDIYEFWNVNSILAAMRGQKVSGISMCLVRDPQHVMASFFVFAIRNGSTMTILTDRDKTPHPAFNRMSRRPDREMCKRAERNWFPYELLKLDPIEDGDGNTKGWKAAARDQIVPINVDAVALKPIRELGAEEFVWTVLMFDLIRDRYWTKNQRLPALSYTGQMVVEPGVLVGEHGALARTGEYRPLELARLAKADVTAQSTASQWLHEPTGFNRWMVDRYGDAVPDHVLNLVGRDERLLSGIAGTEIERVRLESLDPCSFGTSEQIERDRLWVARMNQMAVIQRMAMRECEAEREHVHKWYVDHLKKNQEMLVDACVKGEIILPHYFYECWASQPTVKQANCLQQWVGGYPKKWLRWPGVRLCEYDQRLGGYRCYLTGSVASLYTDITPTCPEALAILCGCSVAELPWPLQHWYKGHPYSGNSILDRLDPEDWVLRNPWVPDRDILGVRLDIGLHLSRSAVHARRKLLGLPRRSFKKAVRTNDDD